MPTTTGPVRSTSRPERRQILMTGALGLAFILAVLAYTTLHFGHISGQEFAPDTFHRRDFSFYQLPVVELQITPIDRSDTTNSLESHLASATLISTKTGTPKRWDLVIARRGFGLETSPIVSQGQSRILCEYLDANDAKNESIWLEWTKKNDALAKVLWPHIEKLAQQELYVFVPDLFTLASNAKDAAQFQKDVASLLAKKYFDFARTHQQLNNHALAVELFGAALVHQPNFPEAVTGRQQSLSALGTLKAEAE